MCDGCPVDEKELAKRLRGDTEAAEPLRVEGPAERTDTVPEIPFAGQKPVWLAAGSPGQEDRPVGVSVRVRDAVSQLARVCFDVDRFEDVLPIMLGWEPTIVPLVLDVARRFAPPGGPVVFVTITTSRIIHDRGLLDLACWERGVLVESASDSARRDAMKAAGFSAAVFIGGARDVTEDSKATASSAAPRFAVGSTGGAAASLLDPHNPDPYCGGGAVPYDVMKETRSYITLMRMIRDIALKGQVP